MPTSKNSAYTGRKIFDYLPKESEKVLKPGSRVLVPFGKRLIVGFILSSTSGSPLASSKLKFIVRDLDEKPLFPKKLFKLLKWSASYYQHPIGEVLSAAIPKKIRSPNPIKPVCQFWKSSGLLHDKNSHLVNNAPKQKELLKLLQQRESLTKKEIVSAGFSVRLITELEKKQLIFKHTKPECPEEAFKSLPIRNTKSLTLNKQQKKAFAVIAQAERKFGCFLLDGITGSVKTEVYMHAMQKQLSKGRQCLVLIPEIGLTPQTLGIFTERFECPITTMHSGLTDKERLTAWNMAKEGSAGILIGTRSAIFTPFANLGIIIVDEEHDSSFKQQEGFKYSARDIAVVRAREENLPVILGSATPSLESLQNTATRKSVHLTLTHRAGNASISTKTIIDTNNQYLENGFSEQLLYKIERHLADKKQVLVFINRRGFAPVLNCQKCGWVAECNNCISYMTVHLKPSSIRCHHCGAIEQIPNKCPCCCHNKLESLGIGTQKLETFLKARFESTPILRIDRDSTRSKTVFQSMLNIINSGESCLLLGTQMIAKGHHFPNVTLVAIINADTGLFSPDFRGQEQMAQTITQVSGRAGRASQSSEVVIQSRHASHTTLTKLMNHSYAEFTNFLLQERQATNMPPFSQLALIKADAKQSGAALNFLKRINALSDEINSQFNEQISSIGPVPAPIEKRAGRFRTQLILKTKRKSTLQQFLYKLVTQVEKLVIPPGVRWSIDVDPIELV